MYLLNTDSFVNSWFETWHNYIRISKNYDNINDDNAINIEFLQDIPYLNSMDFNFDQREYSQNYQVIKEFETYYNDNVHIFSTNPNKSILKVINHLLNISITNPYSIFHQFDNNDEFYFKKTDKSLRQTIIEDLVAKFDMDQYQESFKNKKKFTMVTIMPENGGFFTDINLLLQLNIEKYVETIEYIIFSPDSIEYQIFDDFIVNLKNIHNDRIPIENSNLLFELYPLAYVNFTTEIKKKNSNLFLQLYQFAYMKKLLMYKKGIDLKIKIYNSSVIFNKTLDCDLIFCLDYLLFYQYPWQIPCFFNYFARKDTVILNMYKQVFEDKNLSECWSTIIKSNNLYSNFLKQETMFKNNTALLKKEFFDNDEETEKKQQNVLKKIWKIEWSQFYTHSNFVENNLANVVNFNECEQNNNNSLFSYLNPYHVVEKSLFYTTNLIYYVINLIKPQRNLDNSSVYSSSYSNIKNIHF